MRRGAGDSFALAVTRQSVAQIALAVGCKYTYTSVMDALADLVRDNIMSLGLEAQAKAEAGGRTVVTILDILAALEERQQDGRDRYELDWKSLQNFAFRGDVTQLDRPDALKWCQPFHTHIPSFPVRRKRLRSSPSESLTQEEESGVVYIPKFLPPFPPKHTYCKTGLKATNKTDDPATIQKHRIATKQLIFKTTEKAKKIEGDEEEVEGKTSTTDDTLFSAAAQPFESVGS